MKKSIIFPLIALFALCGILSMASCEKSSDGIFTWTYRDTINTTASQHKAYIGSMAPSPIIVASRSGGLAPTSNHISINLTSLAVGTYTTTSGIVPNGFRYINSTGDDTQTMSGSVTITSYANNLLSGNFSVTVRDLSGVTRPLTGSFQNTPVEP